MRVTKQIGNTYELTTHLDIPIVCDFRSADVERGGQGAPLVPLADMFLFHEYPICLNLGGFANASWDNKGIRYATDLAPCNIIFKWVSLHTMFKAIYCLHISIVHLSFEVADQLQKMI